MFGDTKRQITEQLKKILEYMGTIEPFRGGSRGYKHRFFKKYVCESRALRCRGARP